jgi:hypothetical protein
MGSRATGVLTMHLIRCFAVCGFKINGPPRVGKGPMTSKEDQESSNKAFPSRPTRAGRIETCTELISKAMKCLGNGDKDCVTRLIEELIKANCHNGNAVGREVADKVRNVVHELWLVSNHEEECRLLRMLRDLGVLKGWLRNALGMSTKRLNKWLVKCGIDWEDRVTRSEVVKKIEDLLRERFGWDEVKICEELFKFIGIDVDAFRRYGIKLCVWLEGINELSNLRNPYWFGLKASDLAIEEYDGGVRLELKTTNSIDAVFFAKLLSTVKAPSLKIKWERRMPAVKYVHKPIALSFRVDLNANEWPWPIKLSADELERILNSLSNEELAMFIAGLLDGDGTVLYIYRRDHEYVLVKIAACKDCPKRMMLDVLRDAIARKFGITGSINSHKTDDALKFYNENAVRLLRRVAKYMHHPLRRLRAELVLAYYDGKISRDELIKLYEQTEYVLGAPDVKHNNGLDVLTRAAPQTHTHGVGPILTGM